MRVTEPISAPWKAALFLRFQPEEGRTVSHREALRGPACRAEAVVSRGRRGLSCGHRSSASRTRWWRSTVAACKYSSGAAVLLTTPGAGKWYRSAGSYASQKLRFEVDGSMEWLPQETIMFDGALAEMDCEVSLGAHARYIGWEILCLGRTGSGERFSKGRIDLRNRISRNGKPLWRERGAIDAGGRLMHSAAG